MVDELLGERGIIDLFSQVFEFRPVFLYLSELLFLEPSVKDKMSYLFKLPVIEPDAVSSALVYYHARDMPVILLYHKLTASCTGDVFDPVRKPRAAIFFLEFFLPVHRRF